MSNKYKQNKETEQHNIRHTNEEKQQRHQQQQQKLTTRDKSKPNGTKKERHTQNSNNKQTITRHNKTKT